MPPVTQALIVANILVFGLETLAGGSLAAAFALWPLGPQFAVWQPITYAFLHGSVTISSSTCSGSTCSAPTRARLGAAAIFRLLRGQRALRRHRPTRLRRMDRELGAGDRRIGRRVRLAARLRRVPSPAYRDPHLSSDSDAGSGVRGVVWGDRAGARRHRYRERHRHFAHLGGMVGGYLLIRSWRSRSGARGSSPGACDKMGIGASRPAGSSSTMTEPICCCEWVRRCWPAPWSAWSAATEAAPRGSHLCAGHDGSLASGRRCRVCRAPGRRRDRETRHA